MLQQYGEVLTEHLGSDQDLREKDRSLTDIEIHDRDLEWIVASDLVVAEVTVPSLGGGYEIGRAVHLGKPVLCLFHAGSEKPLSAMIAGCGEVELFRYHRTEELEDPLKEFILNQTKA